MSDVPAGPPPDPPPRKPRGFAAMDRSLVSEIARKGGQAAHRAGTAHEFTSEEAKAAGRKGGVASHRRRQLTTCVDCGGSLIGTEYVGAGGVAFRHVRCPES